VIQDLVDEPAQLERFETALHDALRRAQERGELDAPDDRRALARFLVTVVQGMRVVGNGDVVEVALRALGGSPRSPPLSPTGQGRS